MCVLTKISFTLKELQNLNKITNTRHYVDQSKSEFIKIEQPAQPLPDKAGNPYDTKEVLREILLLINKFKEDNYLELSNKMSNVFLTEIVIDEDGDSAKTDSSGVIHLPEFYLWAYSHESINGTMVFRELVREMVYAKHYSSFWSKIFNKTFNRIFLKMYATAMGLRFQAAAKEYFSKQPSAKTKKQT